MAFKHKKLGSSKRKRTPGPKWATYNVFSALDVPSKKVVTVKRKAKTGIRKVRTSGKMTFWDRF